MLTSAGQAYLPPLREAFTRIAAATDALEPRHARAVVRLGVRSRYDLTGLTRRIERFRADHGRDVHVRVSYPAGFHELLEGKVSAVIDRSLGQQPGFRCDRLDVSAAGRASGPADHLIYPVGVADCQEIVALRDCLLAPHAARDAMTAAGRLSRAVG
jgi:DNA-binding transcriptional LysR family regulator